MSKFQNQSVLIVGGSSGIGAAAALAFAAAGASVTKAARSIERLGAVATQSASSIEVARLDMTDADAVDAVFERRPADDHVVISAAQTPTGPVRKLALVDARSAMDIKFSGPTTSPARRASRRVAR